MQQGIVMDTEEVESNNSVIGVSLCFANKDLSTGYQIKIIGLYVKEEGQDKDFLYAVTTAVTPEYMPDFNDKVLYRFNMQMYLVIGKAQAVNVVINDGASVTHGQFDKYKSEVTANLEKIENAHKEDMSHVAKSASINGGAEILPDSTGKLNLVVPDPDLSEYVSLEQLTEMLQAKANTVDVDSKIKTVTDLANTKANSADVYTKTETDNQINKFDLSKVKFRKQYVNSGGQTADKTWSATKNEDGTYTIDLWQDDWTAAKLVGVLTQLPNKANASDVYTKSDVDSALAADRGRLGKLEGTQTVDSPDFNSITATGVYYITNNNPANIKNNPASQWGVLVVFNGDSQRTEQIYFANDGASVFMRTYGWINGTINWGNWNQLAWKSDLDSLQNNVYTKSDIDGKVNISSNLFRQIQNSNNWKDIFGVYNPNNVLTSLRIDPGGSGPLINNYAAGIGFGGGDTKGVLSVDYSEHQARITGGNGTGPVWSEDIAWKSDVNDLRNQVQQLKDNQFEVQTFTDATAAASWEAQRPGKRMAIVNQ
ncbi:hypothetical protein AY470_01675 [Lactobacillus helveticus]|nr:hypothetical protein AY470_01675 [Lactobacillus helveticus]